MPRNLAAPLNYLLDEANCESNTITCEWPKALLDEICRECTVDDVEMGNYPHLTSCIEAYTNAEQDDCTCIKGI